LSEPCTELASGLDPVVLAGGAVAETALGSVPWAAGLLAEAAG